jgi:hypothetical protein
MAMGLAVVAAVVVALLLAQDERRSGTDLTPNGAFVAALTAGESTCQEGEIVPAGTSVVRVTMGTYGKPGPPVSLTLTDSDGTRTSGTLAAGWREGVVDIPIGHIVRSTGGVRVCLRDDGPRAIAVAGDLPDPGFTMQVARKTVPGRLRYEYMRSGRESWLQLLPTIVYRSTLAKAAFLRHWAWLAATMLMLVAVTLAARTVIRSQAS